MAAASHGSGTPRDASGSEGAAGASGPGGPDDVSGAEGPDDVSGAEGPDGASGAAEQLQGRGLEGTLTALARSAARTAGHASCAGVELTPRGEWLLSVGSDVLVEALNGVQHRHGEGPVMAGGAAGGRYVPDLLADGAWPRFAHAAVALGVRALLTVPLTEPDGTAAGLLTVYSQRRDPYNPSTRSRLCLIARQASSTLAELLNRSLPPGDTGCGAYGELADRILVEQAVGVLAARERCDVHTARVLLHRAAHRRGTTLRAAAADLLTTTGRRLPPPGEGPLPAG